MIGSIPTRKPRNPKMRFGYRRRKIAFLFFSSSLVQKRLDYSEDRFGKLAAVVKRRFSRRCLCCLLLASVSVDAETLVAQQLPSIDGVVV